MKYQKKTEELYEVYNLLNDAKLTNMDDSGKIAVIKILRNMKTPCKEFEDSKDDALKKCQGEDHESFIEKARKWQADGDKCDFTEEEKISINKYFEKYNKLCNEAIKDISEKLVEIEFDSLAEDQFMKLLGSNEWNAKQSLQLMDALCE